MKLSKEDIERAETEIFEKDASGEQDLLVATGLPDGMGSREFIDMVNESDLPEHEPMCSDGERHSWLVGVLSKFSRTCSKCGCLFKTKGLSKEAQDARRPSLPHELVDALQDKVHRDIGRGRAAKTVRGRAAEMVSCMTIDHVDLVGIADRINRRLMHEQTLEDMAKASNDLVLVWFMYQRAVRQILDWNGCGLISCNPELCPRCADCRWSRPWDKEKDEMDYTKRSCTTCNHIIHEPEERE